MEKYTEEQKKQYNDYWSYYYGTEHHDYYSDCMAQGAGETPTAEGETEEGKEGQDGKKKAKKRKHQPQKRDEG